MVWWCLAIVLGLCRSTAAATLSTPASVFEQASTWNNNGNAHLQRGDTTAALLSYEKAVELLPHSVDIRKNIIVVLLKSNNADNQKALNYVIENDLLTMEQNTITKSIPTIASLVGVALYNLNRLDESIVMFEHVVQHLTPNDTTTWSNLGDTYLHKYQVEPAARAYTQLLNLLNTQEQHDTMQDMASHQDMKTQYSVSLYRASSWGCDWSQWNHLESMTVALLEGRIANAWNNNATLMQRTFGDFVDVAPLYLKNVNERHSRQVSKIYNQDQGEFDAHVQPEPLPFWSSTSTGTPTRRALRIGFISSDFGVHPVSSLIRGLLQQLAPTNNTNNSSEVVTYIYIRTNEQSWWRDNITDMYNGKGNRSYVRSLYGQSYGHSIATVQADRLDVLIDLNGWTMHSGLELLAGGRRKRLALVHVTFLGYSMTTGSTFVDYYMTDATATQIETSTSSFTEKLVLTGGSFFANDYVGLQSHVVWKESQERTTNTTADTSLPVLTTILLPQRDATLATFATHQNENTSPPRYNKDQTLLRAALRRPTTPVIYACFSDFRKMDPTLFGSWMNVLRTRPFSFLWLIKHHSLDSAVVRLKNEAAARGIASYRIVVTSKEPWIHHIFTKRTADLILDTKRTNGHTSNADGLWGGVPVLTLQGQRMGTRVSASLLRSLSGWEEQEENDSETINKQGVLGLVTRSMKTYETVASIAGSSKRKQARSSAVGGRVRGGSRLLVRLRRVLRENRVRRGYLFDSKSYAKMFVNRMKTMAELQQRSPRGTEAVQAMHILPGPSVCEKHTHSGGGPGRGPRSRFCRLKKMCNEEKYVTLETLMPNDPFTQGFYNNATQHESTPAPAVVDAPATASLLLLHACELYMAKFIPTPNGWTTATDLSKYLNNTVTAVYLTLVDGAGGVDREKEGRSDSDRGGKGGIATLIAEERLWEYVKECWRVLVHGGALFLSQSMNVVHRQTIRDVLAMQVSGVDSFCDVNEMQQFGSFDVYQGRSNLHRYSARACGKNGPKISVQLQ